MTDNLWLADEKIRTENGITLLCGVDEAGRGPLAGPVCAAAVIFDRNTYIEGLNDSKKLTEKMREKLYGEITKKALFWSSAFVDEKTIDEINILQATFRAMNMAISGLGTIPELTLIDGNRISGIKYRAIPVVKGDATNASIAAASVIAKVTRDRLMYEYAKQYPEYSFDKHKGYGTKIHYDALVKYGPTPIHRMTFLKKLYGGTK